MTDQQPDTPTLDEDVVRAARLDSLGTLLSRILNGLALTPDESKLLIEHIDAEVRESTTARAVAASNKRHVQAIAPEIDRLTAELEDAEQRADDFRQQRDQAQAALARVHRLADLIDAGAPWTANHQDLAGRIRAAATVPGQQPTPAGHRYLSTGCLHGDHTLPDGRTGHQYCQSTTGKAGAKQPAQCKFCGAPCICDCHNQPAPAAPAAPEPVDWRSLAEGFQVLLAAYPADLDPDGPAVRPRPLPAELVARWRDTVHTARQQHANQTTKEN